MALNFPSAPADGDVYDNWVYSSAKGAWLAKPLEPTTAVTSDTAPPNPIDGDMWFNTLDGTTYVWFDDGDTSQWVEMVAPITANGYYSPNYIINGGFDIWQRGTGPYTSAGYTSDRWYLEPSGATCSVSRGEFSSDIGIGAQYFANLNVTVGNDNLRLATRLENIRLFEGRTFTFSFYAKGVNPPGGLVFWFRNVYGTGGSATVEAKIVSTQNLTSSWQKFTYTYAVPSVSGLTVGPNSYLEVGVAQGLDAGTSAWNIQITGVQLEEGTVATNFRRNANSIQGELSACRRYFQAGVPGGAGKINSSTVAQLSVAFTDLMRAAPSISQVATWQILNPGLAFHTVTATDVGGGSARGAVLTVTSSGMAAGAAVAAVPSEGSLWFSAEL